MNNIEFTGTPGFKLLVWGLALAVSPFVLVMADVAIRGGGDANIGLGILALFLLPGGLILALVGSVRVLLFNLRKK